MKTYRVWAKSTKWFYLDVEAESEEQAYAIAEDADDEEFEETVDNFRLEIDYSDKLEEVEE